MDPNRRCCRSLLCRSRTGMRSSEGRPDSLCCDACRSSHADPLQRFPSRGDATASRPTYDVMAFQVSSLMESLNKLDRDCRLLTKEMQVLASDPKSAKTPKKATNLQEMKVHIMGLHRLLDKEGAAHMHKLEAVQKNLKEVKQQADKAAGSSISKIVDQTSVLEKSVVSRSSQMSWMLVVLLVATVTIGVLMWNRMRYYEKKHFI
ncbi:unnamed protein product [Symbiodinium sp. CCMP2592]|nr:unnamed protein product [Symbiodinium sp. CCMP2592]